MGIPDTYDDEYLRHRTCSRFGGGRLVAGGQGLAASELEADGTDARKVLHSAVREVAAEDAEPVL